MAPASSLTSSQSRIIPTFLEDIPVLPPSFDRIVDKAGPRNPRLPMTYP